MIINSNAIVRGTLFAAAAALVITNPFPADAAQMSPLQVGVWKGGAYSNNTTSRFSHCAVSAKYKNGMSLLVSVTGDKKWSVGFASNKWNLAVGEKQPVRFRIDGGNSYNGKAVTKTKFMAQVLLPASKRLFRQFRDGQKFHVKTRRSEFSFNLNGMHRVLPTLVKCTRQHAMMDSDPFNSNSKTSDPFSSSNNWETPRSKPVTRGPTPQTRQEAFTAVSYMLGKAKIRARYINVEDNRKLMAKNDVAWSMNGTVGTFRVMPSSNRHSKDVREHIIKTDNRACAGRFNAKVVGDQSRSANSFMTGCDNVKNAQKTLGMAVYYVLLPRQEGGKYLISIMGKLDNSQRVREMGNHLKGIAIALNANGSVPGARMVSH